ncbi:nitrate reductase cytochrome c-type subunit [Helicobacter sp. 23-1044]
MREIVMKVLSLVLGVFLGVVAIGCGGSGISDEEIGFRSAPVDDESVTLGDFAYNAPTAGESQVIERAFENAPPMISHDVEGMMDITKDMNMCVTCHAPEYAKAMKATPVPASHLFDTFGKGKKVGKEIVASRYNCNLCHAPMTNAKPLIGNTFKPDFRSETDKTKSNLLDVLNEGAKIK